MAYFVGTGGTKLSSNYTGVSNVNTTNKKAVTLTAQWSVISNVKNFDYTGGQQTFTAPYTGYYKLEVWGARGGLHLGSATEDQIWATNASIPGKGGYSTGIYKINSLTSLFVFVGGIGGKGGSAANVVGGYNGGGSGGKTTDLNCTGGGGMTHISTSNNPAPSNNNSGTWNTNGTIIVAGGGGGTDDNGNTVHTGSPGGANDGSGGYGGGLSGGYGLTDGANGAVPGTQTSGYKQGIGESCTIEGDTGGGGGGWYGGKCGAVSHTSGGSGGSGYISSVLTSASTIAGNASMPNPRETGTMVGNKNAGYARITWIGDTL